MIYCSLSYCQFLKVDVMPHTYCDFHVEAGHNTSTVALRVVRGDGKGTQYPGVYLGNLVPRGYKYGDLALQVGGVSRSRWTALARTSRNIKLQTRPLVREGATK
jgi:hypothetical protein